VTSKRFTRIGVLHRRQLLIIDWIGGNPIRAMILFSSHAIANGSRPSPPVSKPRPDAPSR
jgi:hypothetical protein